MTKVATQTETDPYDKEADAFIHACGNDPRQAVVALLGERDYLASRLETLESLVSFGHLRAAIAQQST